MRMGKNRLYPRASVEHAWDEQQKRAWGRGQGAKVSFVICPQFSVGTEVEESQARAPGETKEVPKKSYQWTGFFLSPLPPSHPCLPSYVCLLFELLVFTSSPLQGPPLYTVSLKKKYSWVKILQHFNKIHEVSGLNNMSD